MSHFMSCCKQNPESALGVPLDPPAILPSPASWPQGASLDALELALMPRRKDGTTVSDNSRADVLLGQALALNCFSNNHKR